MPENNEHITPDNLVGTLDVQSGIVQKFIDDGTFPEPNGRMALNAINSARDHIQAIIDIESGELNRRSAEGETDQTM